MLRRDVKIWACKNVVGLSICRTKTAAETKSEGNSFTLTSSCKKEKKKKKKKKKYVRLVQFNLKTHSKFTCEERKSGPTKKTPTNTINPLFNCSVPL